MQPRVIRSFQASHSAIIYTDGAYEDGVGTWGAVVFIPTLGVNTIHWGTVSTDIMDHWRSKGIFQLISQIELFVVLLVKYEYREKLTNGASIFFIDNEAARYSLIKGASPSETMYGLCKCISFLEARYPSADWYERVPLAHRLQMWRISPRGSNRSSANSSLRGALLETLCCHLKYCR